MLLRHSLGLEGEATCVEQAVSRALDAGYLTADLAGEGQRAIGTRAATEAVIEQLERPGRVRDLGD